MYLNPKKEKKTQNEEEMYEVFSVPVDLMVNDILDFVQYVVENLPKIVHSVIDVQQYFSHSQYVLEVYLVNHHIHVLSI